MNIIVTALYSEAKPFIKHYHLQKCDSSHFTIFQSDTTALIVSGMTPCNSAIATTYIINHYKHTENIVNLGICAATQTKDMIGSTFQANKLIDNTTHKVYHLKNEQTLLPLQTVTTFATPQDQNSSVKKGLVDMEATGFYSAASKFMQRENIYICKVVSDRLNSDILKPHEVSDLTGKLIPAMDKLLLT